MAGLIFLWNNAGELSGPNVPLSSRNQLSVTEASKQILNVGTPGDDWRTVNALPPLISPLCRSASGGVCAPNEWGIFLPGRTRPCMYGHTPHAGRLQHRSTVSHISHAPWQHVRITIKFNASLEKRIKLKNNSYLTKSFVCGWLTSERVQFLCRAFLSGFAAC